MELKTKRVAGLVGALLLCGGLAALVGADSSMQEKLEKEQAQIDATVEQAGGTIAMKLSAKFGLTPEELQKIRDGGVMGNFEGKTGWGEITVLLAMAQQLTKTHPKDYPAYDKALAKVRGLKAENNSFEKIGGLVDIDLKPVLTDVQRIRASLPTSR